MEFFDSLLLDVTGWTDEEPDLPEGPPSSLEVEEEYWEEEEEEPEEEAPEPPLVVKLQGLGTDVVVVSTPTRLGFSSGRQHSVGRQDPAIVRPSRRAVLASAGRNRDYDGSSWKRTTRSSQWNRHSGERGCCRYDKYQADYFSFWEPHSLPFEEDSTSWMEEEGAYELLVSELEGDDPHEEINQAA